MKYDTISNVIQYLPICDVVVASKDYHPFANIPNDSAPISY
jgi:ABC-type polysaccharide transport system permease subunit